MAKSKFTIAEKQKIIKYHFDSKNFDSKKQYPNWALRQTANAFNVHHQTIKKWIEIYQAQSLEGLIDKRTSQHLIIRQW